MGNIKLKISDPRGKDFELIAKTQLDKYLDLPYALWSSGSGESTLWKDDSDGLMFFKFDNDSFFIMELSSYASPIQNQEHITWIEHYLGGEPFYFSSKFVCSKEILITILFEYAKAGEKHNDYVWADPLPDEIAFLKFQEQNNKTQ